MRDSSKYIFVAVVLGLAVSWWVRRPTTVSRAVVQSQSVDQASNLAEEDERPAPAGEDLPEIAVPENLPPPASGESAIEKKLSALDPTAKVKILRNDLGVITTMRGFKIKTYPDNDEGMLSLAQELVSAMGAEGQQLQTSEIKLDETPDSKVFVFDQNFQDYPVYAGYLKIFTKKPEGFAYFVANEVKDIGEPDLRIDFSGVEAERIALQKYAGKKELKLISRSDKPFIFSIRPKVSELAWKVQVLWENPFGDRRQLMISAKTGMILEDVSMRTN